VHHDIASTARHDSDSHDQDEASQDTTSRFSSSGAAHDTDVHCRLLGVCVVVSAASRPPRLDHPAPSAWNSATVSDNRAACACTRVRSAPVRRAGWRSQK